MATRGVWQLKRLQLFYAEHAGSSRGVRDFIGRGFLDFARANPQVELEAIQRAATEPHVVGHYLKGAPVTVGLKNADAYRCNHVFALLRNRSNRQGKQRLLLWPGAKTTTPSVQGKWSAAYHYSDA